MKIELFDFQKNALKDLIKSIKIMQDNYSRYQSLSAVSLTSPTGSGKTIISAAVIETLFYGNDSISDFEPDPLATVIWLTDSPSLNKQTYKRFKDASENFNSTNMEIIDQDFARSHNSLSKGKVYFLNRQLLGKGKILSNPTEGGRTFYDVLNNSIEDNNIHVYLFLDEAHRGLGKSDDNRTTSDTINKTIYSTIIDGQEGINKPIPCVIGISATPENFNKAMNGRLNRTIVPNVKISILEVKATGLIKDAIEIRIPDQNNKIKDIDLKIACQKFNEISNAWTDYCSNINVACVIPLLVVQVEDKISNDTLGDLCKTIIDNIKGLDTETCFVNVFGEKSNITTPNGINIPYCYPEDISENIDIKVVFAKDAITTGWDCPRAEILYSRRKRNDETYIAQLIGRMIRTPLVRRTDNEELNTVSCYLPEFDTESVNNVVYALNNDDSTLIEADEIIINPTKVSFFGNEQDRLNAKIEELNIQKNRLKFNNTKQTAISNDEKSIASNTETINKQVSEENAPRDYCNPDNSSNDVIYNASVEQSDLIDTRLKNLNELLNNFPLVSPEEIKECFEKIITRFVKRSSNINEFQNLWECVELCSKISGNNLNIEDEFYNEVESSIRAKEQQFKTNLHDLKNTRIEIRKFDPLTGDQILTNQMPETITTDEKRIRTFFNTTIKVFSNSDAVTYYINKCINSDQLSECDAILRICSVATTFEIVNRLQTWAKNRTKEFIDKYDTEREQLEDIDDKENWEKIKGNVNPYIERNISIDDNPKNQDETKTPYRKHIFSDDSGFAYFDLNETENDVLNTELGRQHTVAWYRNSPRNLNFSFSIAYNKGNDEYSNMYPDFIFFVKVGSQIKPAIVDPHGEWLGDSISKLKGYISYLEDHPDMFYKVVSVTDKKSGLYKYLDLKDPKTQKYIKEFKGSNCKEIFELFGRPYG